MTKNEERVLRRLNADTDTRALRSKAFPNLFSRPNFGKVVASLGDLSRQAVGSGETKGQLQGAKQPSRKYCTTNEHKQGGSVAEWLTCWTQAQ